jgi:hypothetical protein
MAQFNFIGGSYQAPSLNEDAQTCYNLYLETDESGAGKSKAMLLGTPGLNLEATLSQGAIRAMLQVGSEYYDGGGRLFVVAGSKLVEVNATGGVVGGTDRGDVGNDGLPAQIFVNAATTAEGLSANQVFVISAGNTYLDGGGAANGANAQKIYFAAAQYAGTVNVMNGSSGVVWASGTEFSADLVGQTIEINYVAYTVGTFVDNFNIDLTASYAAATASNVTYTATSDSTTALTARSGGFMDGYFFAVKPYSNLFFYSAINDGTQWSPLSFCAKQGAPDHIVAMICDHELIWLFGDNTTEVWQDTGAAPPANPFSRVTGGLIPVGIVSPWAGASFLQGVAWIGADARGQVAAWYATGLVPTRISTHALESIWGDYNELTDVSCYAMQIGGHFFLKVHFPAGLTTWVYDGTENVWHQEGSLISGAQAPILGRWHAYVFGAHYVGSLGGGIYTQDHHFFDDAGTPITRVRAAPYISDENKWTFFGRFRLDAENSGALNPQLDWSDDGANTFLGAATTTSNVAGALAQYDWRRLGKSRARVLRVTITAAVKVALINAYVDTIGGTT